MDLDLPNCYAWSSFLTGDGMQGKKPFIQLEKHGPLCRFNCIIKFSLNSNLANHKVTYTHIKCS